ncbi:uncharacterized protein LOC130748594 [Lotus japonicus]|uniref:uncharacterized protein LOC130748594 n=1 Tax=Lotus japonicus TaxID=34305 RepID=UPI0025857458|nr:uncharacterized protein LOC130748594 [Lotus japonicus]
MHMEYVLAFLMGLNESYSQVRGQVLLMDPLPSINRVFSLIHQEEKQRQIGISSSADPSSSLACVVQANPANSKSHSGSSTGDSNSRYQNKNQNKNRPTCTHCGILGHTKDRCYKIISYPPHYKKTKPVATVNNVTSDSSTQGTASTAPSMALTTQQYQQLLQLLQSQISQAQVPSSTQSDDDHVGSPSIQDDWQR